MSINIREAQTAGVGLQLARIRQSKGISRADVAFRLQVSNSTIAGIEQGQSQLPLAFYRAYCQAIGICPVRAMRQLKLPQAPAAPRLQPLPPTRRGICERFGLRKRHKPCDWGWRSDCTGGNGHCQVGLRRGPMKPNRVVPEEEH